MTQQRTVIVADDEPHILNLVEIILAAEGFRALTCGDGATAFELFIQQPHEVALIVSDLRLPKMSPVRLRDSIAGTDFPVPPMLVFSGLIDHLRLSELFAGGLTHFLQKPFTVDAFLR